MEVFGQIWSNVIIQPMINTLVLLYSLAFSNFGIAIAIFTIVIRGVMMPLTVKQSRQMKAMSALQPKIKEIQGRFANDKQKQSQETMKLYKEQGVNPIGCLGPMFIQMPIWIGLYQAILQTVPTTPESLVGLSSNLYHWLPMVQDVIPLNSGFLWLDLARPDPFPILPVMVGVSMFLMQKMTSMPAADDRQASTNRMMLWMMPLMFGFFSMQFPSGLALYWVISNIVGIVIQGFITGWDPLINILDFKKSRTAEPEAALAADVPHALEESEQDEHNTDDRKDSRGSDRNRTKRARRRPRRGRNRRH
ncbi:TPA: protein translocase component YidC [Candidatus Poribacteria bacterium]|nr:protein translocase component YidC [Candidatus Poribacteria bacterium]